MPGAKKAAILGAMTALRCPICDKPVEPRPTNRFFPFCSGRCRLVDLGKWLGEEYRIPAPPDEREDVVPDGPSRGDDEGR